MKYTVQEALEILVQAVQADMLRALQEKFTATPVAKPVSIPVREPARLQRRSLEALDKTRARLLEQIIKTPGLRMEQLGKELKLSTKELVLPVKQLIKAGLVRFTGQARAVQYYPRKL